MMMRDRSADVLDCPNEFCREGIDTETGKVCLDCEGNDYVMDSNPEPRYSMEDLD
jgi:hypothetical protein